MRVAPLLVILVCLLGPRQAFAAQPPPQEPTPDSIKADEQILKDVKVGTDNAALLDYFRHLNSAAPDPKMVEKLILDLQDKTFKVREQANQKLFDLGGTVLKPLRAVEAKLSDAPNGHVEKLRRVAALVRAIEAKVNPTVQGAAVRLLA